MSNTILINDVEYMPTVSVDQDGSVVTDSNGNPVGSVVVDGLAPTQLRVNEANSPYIAAQVIALQVIALGSGDLTLSPVVGTDIVLTNDELTAMGASAFLNTWYGTYNSVTAGAGMELLAYTRLPQ